jgi:hypothetical protein
MSKPEWCDQKTWALAVKVAHPILWLSAKDEQNGTEHIARTFLTASDRAERPEGGCGCISYNCPEPYQTDHEVVLDHAKYFPDTQKPSVCVDACIAEAIESLWKAGVRTRACCCGHNGRFGPAPSVYLDSPADAAKAYEVLAHDHRDWHVVFWAGPSQAALRKSQGEQQP